MAKFTLEKKNQKLTNLVVSNSVSNFFILFVKPH